MQRPPVPIVKELVLLGGGHSQLSVLRAFGMSPEPGVRVTLVTRDIHTPYSGMLPGYVAGFYSYDDCHIDLAALAEWGGVRFIHAEACGLDVEGRRLLLHGRPPLRYDVLSINVGITPDTRAVPGAAQYTTPVKPIFSFVERFEALLARANEVRGSGSPLRIAVVGGGAGGVELAMALQWRLAGAGGTGAGKQATAAQVTLVSRGPPLSGFPSYARNSILSLLASRGVAVEAGAGVVRVVEGALELAGGGRVEFDECLWCTQAAAPAWLKATGLPTDVQGFLSINQFLQVADAAHPEVFATGDCATSVCDPRPKAGVFAVRQGPPLADNLRRALVGQPLAPFKPQSTFLSLITCGDKYCVGTKGWVGMQGAWLWGLKDWIDRSFMYRFGRELPDMAARPPPPPPAAAAPPPAAFAAAGSEALQLLSDSRMRCGGCAAKVGAPLLRRVLAQLPAQPPHAAVAVGLDCPDDAALLRPPPPGQLLALTVDFLRGSLCSDPYVLGAIAASHCLSDCHAMGATPVSALAVAVMPFASDAVTECDLLQALSGALRVMGESGCALVGGHTAEGAELGLGFSITGSVGEGRATSKAGLAVGDVLLLTKPLGVGLLLAAGQQRKAHGRWVQGALQAAQQSSGRAAALLMAAGVRSCTDVTGWGLLGHAAEMARASQVTLRIDADNVPLLPGAAECAAAGCRSSLHPANSHIAAVVAAADEAMARPTWPLLVDPQTGGGLLAGVPAGAAKRLLQQLREAGYAEAAVVGSVVSRQAGEDGPFIEVA